MNKGKFAIGAIIGAAAGLVAGLLTAPKSGKETRANIKQKAIDLKADAAEKTKDARRHGEHILEETKEKFGKKDTDSRV